MSPSHNRAPHPDESAANPELLSADISGADMTELSARLASRRIDSITVDGVRFVAIGDIGQTHDEELRVVAQTEEGSRHLFVFGPSEQDIVSHYLLAEE